MRKRVLASITPVFFLPISLCEENEYQNWPSDNQRLFDQVHKLRAHADDMSIFAQEPYNVASK